MIKSVADSLNKMVRILTFRANHTDYVSLNSRDLAVGLFFTWLAGMGRYWDSPEAEFVQKLGLGSVVYIFVLGALIWPILRSLAGKDSKYIHVVTFVSLTSAPAIIYAIPVERYAELSTASQANAWFLLAVASYRVAMLIRYVYVFGRLKALPTFVATFLPLTFIVLILTLLNLEKAVFEIMGGSMRHTANDFAYVVLLMITTVSAAAFIPLLLIFVYFVFRGKPLRQ
ncbi:MAG: hypothetical protein ABL958_02200 [Bdellovibrionia bacterium]